MQDIHELRRGASAISHQKTSLDYYRLLQQKYGVPCLNDLATLYPDKLNFEKELRVIFGRFASFLFECSTESAVSNPGTRGVPAWQSSMNYLSAFKAVIIDTLFNGREYFFCGDNADWYGGGP